MEKRRGKESIDSLLWTSVHIYYFGRHLGQPAVRKRYGLQNSALKNKKKKIAWCNCRPSSKSKNVFRESTNSVHVVGKFCREIFRRVAKNNEQSRDGQQDFAFNLNETDDKKAS